MNKKYISDLTIKEYKLYNTLAKLRSQGKNFQNIPPVLQHDVEEITVKPGQSYSKVFCAIEQVCIVTGSKKRSLLFQLLIFRLARKEKS